MKILYILFTSLSIVFFNLFINQSKFDKLIFLFPSFIALKVYTVGIVERERQREDNSLAYKIQIYPIYNKNGKK